MASKKKNRESQDADRIIRLYVEDQDPGLETIEEVAEPGCNSDNNPENAGHGKISDKRKPPFSVGFLTPLWTRVVPVMKPWAGPILLRIKIPWMNWEKRPALPLKILKSLQEKKCMTGIPTDGNSIQHPLKIMRNASKDIDRFLQHSQ